MGIYTPKISPSKLLWGKNDVRTAIEQFYTLKTLIPQKQISGYAPGASLAEVIMPSWECLFPVYNLLMLLYGSEE